MPDVIISHETPTLVSTAEITFPGATRFDIAGRFAYIPSPTDSKFSIVDTSNPDLLEVAVFAPMPGMNPIDVTVSGKFAYISTLNKLQIRDISDIEVLNVVGETASIGTDLRDIFIVGKYALVLVQKPTPKLSVIDIEDPTNPVEVNTLPLNNTPERGHYHFGFIYTCDKEGGVHIINVNDPLNPVIQGFLDPLGDYPELVGTGKDIYVSGRWAYALYDSPPKIVFLDLSSSITPSPETTLTVSPAKTIEIHGNSAYLSSGEVIDVSDPFNPVLLVTGPSADNIMMAGKQGFALDGGNFRAISYSGIDSPTGNIYSLKTSKLTVFDDIDACNNVRIHNKLGVGQGGIHCDGEVYTKGDIHSPNLQETKEKDQPNGYAGLDANGDLPISEIPTLPESLVANLVSDLAGKEPLLGFIPVELASNTVHVKSMSNFPAPVSGVITLGVDTTYILANSLVTSDRFVIQDQSSNFITSGNANVSLTYTGSDTLFTSANDATDGRLTLISLDIQSSGSGTLFNLKNQALDVFRSGLFNFADLGVVRNAPFTALKFSLVLFNGQGLKIIDSSVIDIFRSNFANSVDTSQPYFTIIGNNPVTGINDNLFNRLSNETVVFVDPNLISLGGGTIFSNTGGTVGAGFFKVGANGSITTFADSTVEAGVKTKVTSIAHGLVSGEAVVITGTTNYDGTFLILNVTTDTFDIEKVFSVDDATGTWDTSSLDETDVLVRVRDVAFQKPSFSIADAQHNTSTTTVITTVDEIVTLGGTNWTKGNTTERFTIGSDGIITYIGLEPTTFKIEARTIMSKDGGGSDLIEVGFKVNGVVDFNSFRGVDNSGPASCNPAIIKTMSINDTVQIVGRNRTTNKDIILDISNLLITTV